MKVQLFKYFEDVSLDEKTHIYHTRDGKIFLSASGIIKKFYKPFRARQISKSLQTNEEFVNSSFKIERGLKDFEYRESWAEISRKATEERGTPVHDFGEKYAENRGLKFSNNLEKAIVKFWNDLPGYLELAGTEVAMYHPTYGFCGTADFILYNNLTNTYIIGDYKTNKDIFKNFAGQKLLGIFSHLLDMPFNKYQIQFSLYQILLEQIPEVRVSSRKLVWLLDSGEYALYDTDDYTKELKKYLDGLRKDNSKS